jgi:ParB family chromosome partitioning protein
VADLEERLRVALGTRVSLRRGRRGGRLTIHFYTDEELQALLDLLLGS